MTTKRAYSEEPLPSNDCNVQVETSLEGEVDPYGGLPHDTVDAIVRLIYESGAKWAAAIKESGKDVISHIDKRAAGIRVIPEVDPSEIRAPYVFPWLSFL